MAGFLGPLLLVLLLQNLGHGIRLLVSIRVLRSELPVAGILLLGLYGLLRLVRLLLVVVLIAVFAFCGFTLLVLVLSRSGSRSRSCPRSHLQ